MSVCTTCGSDMVGRNPEWCIACAKWKKENTPRPFTEADVRRIVREELAQQSEGGE